MTNERVALVVGAGDAIGSAILRRFAVRGDTVCAARRKEGKQPLVDLAEASKG